MAKAGRKQFGLHPDELAIVTLIKLKARKRKGGNRPSYNAIAKDLNAEGYRTKTGKLWRAQTVKNVLENPPTKPATPSNRAKKTSLATGDFLTKQQLAKVFEAARLLGPQDEVIVAVLVGAGLRASELCALQRRDLGIDGGQSQIDVRRGKGAKQRSVFISEALRSRLQTYLWGKVTPKKSLVFMNCYGQPLTYDALYKRIKCIGRMAGMPSLHPHALRHTFGTLLYHYKKDLFFVKEQLGHSKVETTQIYAKTLTESKLEQMAEFGNDLSGLLNVESFTDNTSKPERPA